MIKSRKKSISLNFILILSLFTGITLLTSPTLSSESGLHQSGPECGDILVIEGNVSLPFPLTAVYGVFNQTEFNWTDDWRAQPGIQNYYNETAGSKYYNLTIGSVITNINLPNATWVVVVVADDKSSNNIALNNTCPMGPEPGGFPFKTITYGVKVGDVFTYKISLNFDGATTTQPMPFFDMKNSNGSEFTIKNNETMTVKVIDVVGLDMVGSNQLKSSQEPDSGPGFGINITLSSGGKETNKVDGFVFALPIEIIEYFIDNGTNIFNQPQPLHHEKVNQDDGGGGPTFWETVINYTLTTVTTGSNDSTFTITYDRAIGVFTQLTMSGQPEPSSPYIELSIDLITDVLDDDSSSTDDSSSSTDDGSSSTDDDSTSDNSINSTPGFELVFLIFGVGALAIIRRKN